MAANQTTVFYTDGEGRTIRRFDTVGGQLADFAVLPGAGNGFALRLLPPGDGSGGLLVADLGDIKRLDGAGAVSQIYDIAGEDNWFSLNLDPNGASFWAGDFGTNNFYRFNIATGVVEVGPINSGGALFGICLKGEPTAGTGPVTCTLGFWKTHPEEWTNLDPDDMPAWGGGLTYLEILGESAEKGDASVLLAHGFIAATLNSGADATLLTDAEAMLTAHPIGSGDLQAKGKNTHADRAMALGLAEQLQAFNESLECPLPREE
ncbi:MAG: hypothetical protein HY532_08715 [Chloroflexi bacterium]|nr:hypothetical protein [Chloroflexota bacterium]